MFVSHGWHTEVKCSIGWFLLPNKDMKYLVLVSGGLPLRTRWQQDMCKGKRSTSGFRLWLMDVCA